MEEKIFKPEKLIWTTEDFDQMNWHDSRLHGLGFAYEINPFMIELRLDIDHIFKWCGHGEEPGPSGFWISPSTMVFERPSAVKLEVLGSCEQYIMEINRSRPRPEVGNGAMTWHWKIFLNTGGTLSFRSCGLTQFTRLPPVFVPTPAQSLQTAQRGTICFEKSCYDETART
ncbi:MAG: hypothetical protein HY043_11685 [Verrucomicrobia bacterium]|nr:hypothetical protein [Verrucomicrobiota bacterium]